MAHGRTIAHDYGSASYWVINSNLCRSLKKIVINVLWNNRMKDTLLMKQPMIGTRTFRRWNLTSIHIWEMLQILKSLLLVAGIPVSAVVAFNLISCSFWEFSLGCWHLRRWIHKHNKYWHINGSYFTNVESLFESRRNGM